MCPTEAARRREASINTRTDPELDDGVFLEGALVLRRYANGDWRRTDDEYGICVAGDVDELQLRIDAVQQAPRALAKSFERIAGSRWKGGYT